MNTINDEAISKGLSIIVPFLNEEEGITQFCEAIDEHSVKLSFPIEIVFVNDGSTDNSLEVLRSYEFKNIKRVKLVDLSKNFGSHAAIRAGVANAYYGNCTWMGSDLQEPIEFLAMSYEKLLNGYDAVYVEKKSVKVSSVNRGFSKMYSRMMQKYAVKSYSSGGISVIVFNQKIKELLNHNIESNSSIMLQIMDAGYRYTTLSLDFHERSAGVSKWTLSKKIKLFIDSFVAFSFMPIRLVSLIGIFMFLAGIGVGIFTVVNKIINPSVPIGYSTLASIMAMGFGITNISLGIIAEYLWRAYDAARKRPVFIVSEVIDLGDREVS